MRRSRCLLTILARVSGVILVLLMPTTIHAGWTIETIAGTGVQGFSGDGGPATRAELDNPFGVIRGPDGTIWFCEYTGQRVRRVDPDGIIHTVAGNGRKGYTGDGGPAAEASFNLPHEIRLDGPGNLYVADMANHVIRRIDGQSGIITTIVGNGVRGYSGDGGPATDAQLDSPHSIQVGPDGQLYICDTGNHVIRIVDLQTGILTTFAGTGEPGPTPDGSPISGTPLNGPRSLDFDPSGDLWLATREGNQIFRFDLAAGTIQLVAGTGEKGASGNGGPARLAELSGPKGLTVDARGNIWISDTESHTLRMIDGGTGIIDIVAGTGEPGDGPDGVALDCGMNRPHGVFVNPDGSILIGDSGVHRLRLLRRGTERPAGSLSP